MSITFMTNIDEEEILDQIHTPTSEIYFDVDNKGFISLKSEYRGLGNEEYEYSISDTGLGTTGSCMTNLPEILVIPRMVGNIEVKGYQSGIFTGNHQIKEIVLLDTIEDIPDGFCKEAIYLKSIHNTNHIKHLGNSAFEKTRLEIALFPNLETCGDKCFYTNLLLKVADIGKIKSIGESMFRSCVSLLSVHGGKNVTSIGDLAFLATRSLVDLPLLDNKLEDGKSAITYLGYGAFQTSRIQFNWTKLDKCNVLSKHEITDEDEDPDVDKTYYATPITDNILYTQDYPGEYSNDQYDYWSEFKLFEGTKEEYLALGTSDSNYYSYFPCKNRLGTIFCQSDDRWRDEQYFGSDNLEDPKKYYYGTHGCAFFTSLHIHSALSGTDFNTPMEYEEILIDKLENSTHATYNYTNLQFEHPGQFDTSILGRYYILGYDTVPSNKTTDVVDVSNPFNKDDLKAIYKALCEGSYVALCVGSSSGTGGIHTGHMVMVYGVNNRGELLVLDSGASALYLKYYDGIFYTIAHQNICSPRSYYYIVSKKS